MSLEASIWAWSYAGSITPSELLVLLRLANHADEDGACFPSQKYLHRKTGLSERCVRDCLKALEAAGEPPEDGSEQRPSLITRTKRNHGPDPTSDAFILHMNIMGPNIDPPAKYATTDRQISSERPARSAAKSSIEPSKGNRSPDGDSDAAAPAAAEGSKAVAKAMPIQEAFDTYNTFAQEHGWAVATRLSDARRKSLRARLVEHGIDGWKTALIKSSESPFLMGRTQANFRITIDFLLQPSKLQKTIEGGYDATGGGNGGNGSGGSGASAGGGLGLRGNDIAAMHEAAVEFGDEDYR